MLEAGSIFHSISLVLFSGSTGGDLDLGQQLLSQIGPLSPLFIKAGQ